MADPTPLGTEGGLGLAQEGQQPFFPVRSGAPPPRPPQLRGRGGRVLPRGQGREVAPVRGVGPFRGGGVGPFRRPAGRCRGAFRSARAVGAVVRARAASRLRSRGASRGAFGAPVLAGGSGVAVPAGGLAPVLAGGSGVAVPAGGFAPVLAGEPAGSSGESVPRGSYALVLGSAPAVGSAVSPGGPVLGAPVASALPGGACFGGACRFCFARGVCLFGGA